MLEMENIKSKIKDGFVKIYPQQDDEDVEILMINQVIQTDDVYIISSQDGASQQLSPNSKHNQDFLRSIGTPLQSSLDQPGVKDFMVGDNHYESLQKIIRSKDGTIKSLKEKHDKLR